MFPQMSQVYQASLHSGNQYEALIQILSGNHFEGGVDVESNACEDYSLLSAKQVPITRPSFKGVVGSNFYVNLIGLPPVAIVCTWCAPPCNDDIMRKCSLVDTTHDDCSTTLLNIEYKLENERIEGATK